MPTPSTPRAAFDITVRPRMASMRMDILQYEAIYRALIGAYLELPDGHNKQRVVCRILPLHGCSHGHTRNPLVPVGCPTERRASMISALQGSPLSQRNPWTVSGWQGDQDPREHVCAAGAGV